MINATGLIERGHSMSFEGFCQLFHSEEACYEALYEAKWPVGYCCERCSHGRVSLIRTRRLPLYECLNCHYQASLITGTVMEGSRTPLHKWFQAIYLIASPASTINAVKLAGIIGVTYKTSWLILHKLRYVMSQANAYEPLTGIVRINSAVYGKPYNSTIHRHPQEHPLLVGASMNNQGEPIHVKIKQIHQKHLSVNGILRSGTNDFVEQHVETPVANIAIETKRYNLRGFQPLLQICKEAGNWLNNVFHGVGPKHLQVYLDEFCFRMNHYFRDEAALNQLFSLAAITPTITYSTLIRATRTRAKYSLISIAAA